MRLPTRVVFVGGGVLLRVGDGGDQACGRVCEGSRMAQRIGDLREFTLGVISELCDASEWARAR